MTFHASDWPVPILKLSRVQNGSAAVSEVIAHTAGGTLTMIQHINGEAGLANEVIRSPRNPSGEFGHDHSGGYFGRGLFRSVASVCFDNFSHLDPTHVLGNGQSLEIVTPQDGDSTTTDSLSGIDVNIWIPPCPQGADGANRGAYIDLGVVVHGSYDHDGGTAGMLAGDVVDIVIVPRHYAYDGENDSNGVSIECLSLPVGTPEATQDEVLTSGPSTRLDWVRPGAFNPLRILLRATRTTGGGERLAQFRLDGVEFGVYE